MNKYTLISITLALMLSAGSALADVADEIKVLIEQGKAKEAYELGLKHQDQLGEVRFDYAFGVAAIDSGRVSLGVLSLERVLLANPGDDLVRLELARGYFNLGEYQRAKDEFEEVKSHKPPAGVVNTINIYLDLIKDKEKKLRVNGSVYAEFGIGYNSNVNTATAVNNIISPIYGPIQLTGTSTPQPSPFSFLSAGGTVNVPLATFVTSFTSVSTLSQRYSQVDGYDLGVSNALTGVKFDDNQNVVKIAAFGTIAKQDQIPVPNTLGAGAQYERILNNRHSVSVAASSNQLNYSSEYQVYNSTLNTGSLGYRVGFPTTKWAPVLSLNANVAQQGNTQNRPDLSRRIAGAAFTVFALPSDKWAMNVNVGYTRSNYEGQDLIYLAYRQDGLLSANAALEYKLSKHWSTRAELTYFDNQSNLNLYSFQQVTGALKLRYEWDF
jgi:tetratricopeptide (TPR) repeat protein